MQNCFLTQNESVHNTQSCLAESTAPMTRQGNASTRKSLSSGLTCSSCGLVCPSCLADGGRMWAMDGPTDRQLVLKARL
jgi:hypothetical protein